MAGGEGKAQIWHGRSIDDDESEDGDDKVGGSGDASDGGI